MSNTSTRKRIAVIMAGGSGERFWPLSRQHRPKQLLRLGQRPQTMLHDAVDRIAPLIPAEDVYVVTGTHLVEAIRAAKIGIPDENVIAEPCKRNTAGCLAYATAYLLAKYGLPPAEMTMVVTTADHVIGDEEVFRATVAAACATAEREGALATMGIVPTRAETGYGYIEVAAGAKSLNTGDGPEVLPVASFKEKPDAATAEEYVKSGRYYWNSGMFCWSLETFLEEMHEAQPKIAAAIGEMCGAMQATEVTQVEDIFATLEDISIDSALLERAKQVVVARAEFPWDDVGAWPALDRTRDANAEGNVAIGDPVLIDSEGCIVYNAPGAEKLALAVIGCSDLIVVATEDAVLVVPKDRAQEVKQAVAALKVRGAGQV